MHRKRTRIRKIGLIEQYIMMFLGTFIMALGFHYFIIPVNLVTGGVTGIGIVVHELIPKLSISMVAFVFNGVFLLSSLIFLGKKIFLRSIYGSLLFPLILFFLENFSPNLDLPNDMFLIVLYGGFIVGLGFGIVIRYGGTTGGSDIPIKIVQTFTRLPLSVSIYLVDGFIVVLGVIVFISQGGIVNGLYAIIAMYISGRAADFVIVGLNTKKTVNIITDKPKDIKETLFQVIGRGVTEVEIVGGYTSLKRTMLITVITKNEYAIVRNIIAGIDPKAFVYVTPASEIHGEWESTNEV